MTKGKRARTSNQTTTALLIHELRDDSQRQRALTLIHELWADHRHACPYVRHDERGCLCTSPIMGHSVDNHMPCDVYSVQFWCLTDADHTRCCLYPTSRLPAVAARPSSVETNPVTWGNKAGRHKTEPAGARQERRRHGRKSGPLVLVSVRTPDGRVCEGTVLNVSEGGISLFTEILPGCELLDIQLAGSALSIRVITKHRSDAPLSVGYVIGCAFVSAPAPEILQALYVPREVCE